MLCPKCGTKNDADAAFCDACGRRLVENAVKKRVEDALSGKTKAFIGGFLSVAIALVVIVPLLLPLVAPKKPNPSFVLEKPSLSAVVCGDGTQELFLGGESLYRGDLVGGLTDVCGDTVVFGDGERLWLASDGEKRLLSECAVDYRLSRDGSCVYYLEGNTLLRHHVPTAETSEIPWEGQYLTLGEVSPKGDCLHYRVFDGLDSTDYRYRDGVSTEIELGETTPLGVSDDGEVTFLSAPYYENDVKVGLTLYGWTDGEGSKLGVVSSRADWELNADGSQLLFRSNGNTYLSVDGGEKVKLCSYEVAPVCPEGCVAVEDFRDCLFYGNETLLSFDFEREEGVTVREVTDATLNDAGDTVYYRKHSILYSVSPSDIEKPKVLSSDLVKSYAFTQDGKYVYYINSEAELIARRVETGKETRIANDAHDVWVTDEGEVFVLTDYYRGIGELRYGKGTELAKIASDVHAVYVLSDEVAYGVNYHAENGTFDLCYRQNGDTFVPVAEAVIAFGFGR